MGTTSTPDTSTGVRRSLSAAESHSEVTSAGYRGIDSTALISGTPPLLLGQSTDRSTVRDTARVAVTYAALPPQFVEASTRDVVLQRFPPVRRRGPAPSRQWSWTPRRAARPPPAPRS